MGSTRITSRAVRAVGASVLSVATIGSVSTAANAAPAAAAPRVNGYTQQVTQVFDLPPKGPSGPVTADCPEGTKLYGGGVVVGGASLRDVVVNSSIPAPNGQTWSARVTNGGRSDGTVQVWATCGLPIPDYTVVVGSDVPNPSGKQTVADAACPSGLVPFSGGGFNTSGSRSVKLNSSYPMAHGWRVRANNASAESNNVAVYVTCGQRPAGYRQLSSTPADVAPHSRRTAETLCPADSVVLGGGGRSNSRATAVDLYTSVPTNASGWVTYQTNDTDTTTQLRTTSTCARSDDA